MIPFLVLLAGLLFSRLVLSASWILSLRGALAAMLLVTASAHWGKRRADLIRMIPPLFPNPPLLVTLTGVLEVLGAAGLLLPATARVAATCLAVLLVAMFPANVYAAKHHLSIGGKKVTGLVPRTAMQVVFIAAFLLAGWA